MRFILIVYAIQFLAHGIVGILNEDVSKATVWLVSAVVVGLIGFVTARRVARPAGRKART
ncbi:MAG: hypothetical protein HYT80_03855 [Euryarchaeota archaeon]|nr:hypothetical protein [Euryarchaeota archaeon]